MSIPKLKKKVSDFFIGEEGSISKDKLLKTGVIIAGVAMSAGIVVAAHTNDCTSSDCGSNCGPLHSNVISLIRNTNANVAGNHCNGTTTHGNHSSHSSHSSHGHSW